MSVYRIGNKSSESPFPKIRPTLDLDFANSKTLDPRITFRRASGGSYFGPDGRLRYAGVNEPRFDHDPVTGECLGLLVEEQRTNLLLWSEDFRNTAEAGETRPWFYIIDETSVSANNTVAPDGTTTASLITADIVGGIAANVAVTATTTYCASCYVKAGTVTSLMFRDDVLTDLATVFDLSNGGSVTSLGSADDAGVIEVNNDWLRIYVVFTTPVGTEMRYWIRSNQAIPSGTWYQWGAQLEEGAFPTSYIPTTDSTVTRGADVAGITGSAFSSWYRQDEGTVFADAISPLGGNFFSINDGTIPSRITSYFSGPTNPSFLVSSGEVASCNLLLANITAGSRVLQSSAYQLDNFAGSVNGNAVVVDTSGNVPSVTKMEIGRNVANGAYVNGPIRRLTYWPQRLSNATLQRLTR